jgi:hypothetical protein
MLCAGHQAADHSGSKCCRDQRRPVVAAAAVAAAAATHQCSPVAHQGAHGSAPLYLHGPQLLPRQPASAQETVFAQTPFGMAFPAPAVPRRLPQRAKNQAIARRNQPAGPQCPGDTSLRQSRRSTLQAPAPNTASPSAGTSFSISQQDAALSSAASGQLAAGPAQLCG